MKGNNLIGGLTSGEVSQESKLSRTSDECDFWIAKLDNKGMKYGRW